MRRVGVEIELAGPGVESVTEAVREVVGGDAERISRYEIVLHGDPAGPWRIELDFAYLKERGRGQAEVRRSPSLLGEASEAVLRAGAETFVPVEVVSPPLPIPDLTKVQRLLPGLRRRGALGTRASLAYAFGMQLNPEVPRRDAATIVSYIRAFLCLQDWLLREIRVDLTRRLTRFSAPFPLEYVERVLDPGYAPGPAELIDDYLESSPTRNRALDLLTLFAELDEPRVRRVVSDALVKARPTFHYRLPNSEIDDPAWGIHIAWNRWLQVEHLAADGERLAAAAASYLEFLANPLNRWFGSWAEGVEPWLTPPDALGSE